VFRSPTHWRTPYTAFGKPAFLTPNCRESKTRNLKVSRCLSACQAAFPPRCDSILTVPDMPRCPDALWDAVGCQDLTGLRSPNEHRSMFRSRSEHRPVITEGDRPNEIAIMRKNLGNATVTETPKNQLAVRASRGLGSAIRAERHEVRTSEIAAMRREPAQDSRKSARTGRISDAVQTDNTRHQSRRRPMPRNFCSRRVP